MKLLKYSIYPYLISFSILAQSFEKKQTKWVDSLYNSFTENERLGQLFMIAAYSNKEPAHAAQIDTLIQKYNIGGLIFMQGGPKRQANLTNRFQSKAKVPLLISMDAEWGLQMRLVDSTMQFPRQMTLGAIKDNSYLYLMGKEIAKHCLRLGVHINFAPVVDVNVNPENPVIGVRSFGEDKIKVAQKGIAYMKGLQHAGVMANAKHFPGHGDTDADSHYDLPVIKHDKKRINDIELYPFKKLFEDSLQSLMVAHIHFPTYDDRPNMPTTLSKNVVTELLKKQLKFNGLVFTDALNMKGVSKFYQPGEVDVMALEAGNDVLLFSENVPVAIQKINEALTSKRLDKKQLEISIKKILAAKYKAGFWQSQTVDTTQIYQDLNSSASKALRQTIFEKALTVVRNDKNIIPIKDLSSGSIANVMISNIKQNEYVNMFDNYAPISHFKIAKNAAEQDYNLYVDSLKSFSKVIISVCELNNKKKENYGIPTLALDFMKKLQSKTEVIIIHFGNAYALKNYDFSKNLICAYEDLEVTKTIVPQLIFGAIGADGRLPVTISNAFKLNDGIDIKPLKRLKYAYPETENIPSANFQKLDSIIYEALKDGSTPGAQLMICRKGTVVYRKNFGYQSYDRTQTVNNQTVYDLASVTKTAATMQAIMFLSDWKKFNEYNQISDYLSFTKKTNKQDLICKDILVHQAGLIATLEHWRKTMKDGKLDANYYQNSKNENYLRQVAAKTFTPFFTEDSVMRWTLSSRLLESKSDTGCHPYKYSDLAFYFMKAIAEKQLNQPLDEFLKQNFYSPLGLKNLTYKPLENNIDLKRIAPTEEDKIFRASKIQGTVHDQGAAMLGGLAGHAGLFGTANDLAILGQMNLQYGFYGGYQYLKKFTIQEYTRQQYSNNRRAMGWDRPFPPDEVSLASASSFGHTGFTGTAWWIDPKEEIVFVFLSNRTYPFAENKRLTTNSVRTKLLNAVYEAIEKK
ncbi:MAG: glycosyl hydrolase [Cytophagales bacterium]|nr:MAG: glycosyl hydrolase [Cytophagales bacterium]